LFTLSFIFLPEYSAVSIPMLTGDSLHRRGPSSSPLHAP
jgi:hypothetical protein